jgi:hypothetical protein
MIFINPHQDRKRVLLIAYSCSTYRGSEPGVGWHRAIDCAKYFDTWVICKKQKYEDEFSDYLKENEKELEGLRFVFVPHTYLGMIMLKIPGMYYFGYNLWHRRAYKIAVKLYSSFRFNLLHQSKYSLFSPTRIPMEN